MRRRALQSLLLFPHRAGAAATATTHTLLRLGDRPLSSINVPPPKPQRPPFNAPPGGAAAAQAAAAETVTVEINGKPIEVPGYSTVGVWWV